MIAELLFALPAHLLAALLHLFRANWRQCQLSRRRVASLPLSR